MPGLFHYRAIGIFSTSTSASRLTAAHTAERCILDFSGFRCGDATFLNELVYTGKVRRAQGRPPAVFVISPAETMVKKILELTHLASIWPIFESMVRLWRPSKPGLSYSIHCGRLLRFGM